MAERRGRLTAHAVPAKPRRRSVVDRHRSDVHTRVGDEPPQLDEVDISACLAYGAMLANGGWQTFLWAASEPTHVTRGILEA